MDCVPLHQQEGANALAGIVTSVGSITGFLAGYTDLPHLLPFLGHTQFQVLCSFAGFVLMLTVAISCMSISERDPFHYGAASDASSGAMFFFKALFSSMRNLPRQVCRVCYVQVFAWIGIFPFLFYATTWVSGVYADPIFRERPGMSQDEINAVYEQGTRVGTFALFVFSLVTLFASVAVPNLVVPTYESPQHTAATLLTPSDSRDTAGQEGPSHSQSYVQEHRETDRKRRIRVCSWESHQSRMQSAFGSVSLSRIRLSWLTLRRTWLLSHVCFAFLMLATVTVESSRAATALVSLVGIPWAITNWAPFALIAAEISKRDTIRRGLRPAPSTTEGEVLAGNQGSDSGEQAGVVLGIHNVAIAAPQVISTLASSLIFRMLQKPRGVAGDSSVGWTLRFGGVCAIAAAWCTRYVGEGDQGNEG